MNAKSSCPFHAGLGCEVGEAFKGFQKLGPTIRIARVVENVRAEEDLERPDCFRIAKREAKQQSVSGRHVGYGNAVIHFIRSTTFGNCDFIRKSRAAKAAQVDLHGTMFDGTECASDVFGSFKFNAMPLPVIDAQCVDGISLSFRDHKSRGTIETAAEKKDCFDQVALCSLVGWV